ncbi:MAG TPA: SDR family oxidoreductase [Candidatus Marinimicrobia bacterium]|mgnify:FL=1|nr:SDR family oxidoreductase [Candidatus Neomarinimicrobiota bacterium]
MKRILVTGASGQLGRAFIRKTIGKYIVLGTGRKYFDFCPFKKGDITDRNFIKQTVDGYMPDAIVHFAAMTGVDECEQNHSEAESINTASVEQILNEFSGYFIFISTDYVFDGKDGPYSEKEKTNPINVYGKTKLEAESIIRSHSQKWLILRTNVLFDYTDWTTASFVNWVVSSLRNRKSISVVLDQFNNPIWTDHLAQIIYSLMEIDATGLYHSGGIDYISRYDFALMIAKKFKLDSSLVSPITTKALNQRALRPLKGGLRTEKITDDFGIIPPSIDEALSAISGCTC